MSFYLPVLDYGGAGEEKPKADGACTETTAEMGPAKLLTETKANLQEALSNKNLSKIPKLKAKKPPSSSSMGAMDLAGPSPPVEGDVSKGRECHKAAVKGRPRQSKTMKCDKGNGEERKKSRAEKRVKALLAIRKVVLEVQMKLLEGVTLPSSLEAAGCILTQANYDDVVSERALANLCGYPLCMHKLPEQTFKGRYHISLSQKKVYSMEEVSRFCCSDCAVKSKRYSTALRVSHPSSFAGLDVEALVSTIRSGVVSAPSSPPLSPSPSISTTDPSAVRSGGGDFFQQNGILPSTSHTNGTACPSTVSPSPPPPPQSIVSHGPVATSALSLPPVVIQEKSIGVKCAPVLAEFGGPSDAVEGYVPRFRMEDAGVTPVVRRHQAVGERESTSGLATAQVAGERVHGGLRVGRLETMVVEEGSAAGGGAKGGKRRLSWADEGGLPLVSVQEIPGLKELRLLAEVARSVEMNMGDLPGLGDVGKALEGGVVRESNEERGTSAAEGLVSGGGGEDERVRTARAIASALAEAAEVTVTQDVDFAEAAARAGLSIVPRQYPEENLMTSPVVEEEGEKNERLAGSSEAPVGAIGEAAREDVPRGNPDKAVAGGAPTNAQARNSGDPTAAPAEQPLFSSGLSRGSRRVPGNGGVHAGDDEEGLFAADDLCSLPPAGFRKEVL